MLSAVEQSRLKVSRATDAQRKSQFGQFLTPATTSQFMAGLFQQTPRSACRLLDAGAGIGSLTAAFLDRWNSGGLVFSRVDADLFEIDERLHPHLNQTLDSYREHLNVLATVRKDDFVMAAAGSLNGDLFAGPLPAYTHAILNPPYKKIRNNSSHRVALAGVGIETVNLYSGFVALALSLLEHGGQLVAIIPRSFCNGPYYHPFRKFMLERAAIRHMHLFDSRSSAFKDDGVLQENIIIMLERGGQQGDVTVSTSTDDSFADLTIHTHPFDRIVFPDDPEHFIHVPTSTVVDAIELSGAVQHSLADIGVMVSTGPVVDFRLREHLRDLPEPGTVPLIYPGHVSGSQVMWPRTDVKKPNAIHRNAETERWLYPVGFYCVVRRFSSKEESRRIMASVVGPDDFDGADRLGFENHLNVFHLHKQGLPKALAHGLALFLNSTAVDEHFRRFNGHTQVNATDLRAMKYPGRDALIALGEWGLQQGAPTQAMIDARLESLIS
jgi:adenine-specific DNA-methyltransferase